MFTSIAFFGIVFAVIVTSVIAVGRVVARDGYGRIPDRSTDLPIHVGDPALRIR